MCNIVVINRGEKEIETPRQFEEHFGFLPLIDESYNEMMLDCCLCQCDIEETFKSKNIPFKKDCGDFYVGQLDEVVPKGALCECEYPIIRQDLKEYCSICQKEVNHKEADLCDDSCKYYCTKGFTQERECLTGRSEQLKCDCCNGTGMVEGDYRDELESCLTCNGRGTF